MIKLLYYIIIGILLYSLINQLLSITFKEKKRKEDANPNSNSTSLIRDPFCDTFIIKKDAIKRKIGNDIYYFCSDGCVDGFKKRLKDMNEERKGVNR